MARARRTQVGERAAGPPGEAGELDVSSAPAVIGRPSGSEAPTDRVGRAAVTITGWNLVSRLTGFGRVIVTGAALGITGLGDTYQAANVVSNILFELLAGGLLFSVLVPTFVALIDGGHRERAGRVAGALVVRMLAGLSVLVVLGGLAGPWIMRAFTLGGVGGAVRDQEVALGSFLLWFFLPQLLLYAAGAVATALLQADRRFVAAAMAPVANNLVVIATMFSFMAISGPGSPGLDLDLNQKLVLGLGTSAGVLAMTLVPLWAVARAQLATRPRWHADPGYGLGPLARKGAWGAGHVGLNQIMVFVTLVLAHQVSGGQAAYQMAFTFFLLPHAVLGNPLFTALFPKLSADRARHRLDSYAADLSVGVRTTIVLILPAAGLLAVLALPALNILQGFGQLDEAGVTLVAEVLAAYAFGLLGYSGFFLLTRASYALDDVRAPTLVNLGVTAVAVVGMVAASVVAEGNAKVVVLGLVHAVAVTAGSAVLLARLRRQAGRPVPFGGAFVRAGLGTVAAGAVAWVVSHGVGWDGRVSATVSVLAAATLAGITYLGILVASGAPELVPVYAGIARARERVRR